MDQTILVIDDSEDIHKLLDVRLREEGVLLHHALSSQEGLRMALELDPDLVLLDVDMPAGTGFDVCVTLKNDSATASVPVIFLTASSSSVDKVRGFDIGAVDYITKPFEAAELKARVRAALRTKRYHDLLAARSNVDALTGLWNRRYFDERLKDEVAANRCYHRKVSLIMLDVDEFKKINDRHGHPFGDRVLEGVGELLRTACRTTDAACRYGGDEFALILTETPLSGSSRLAERLCKQVAAMAFRVGGQQVQIGVSVGVTEADVLGESTTSEALLSAADDALYEAKRCGRNCIRTSVDAASAKRLLDEGPVP
jgi:diguanylate cyclase (GGDEF)-like protein